MSLTNTFDLLSKHILYFIKTFATTVFFSQNITRGCVLNMLPYYNINKLNLLKIIFFSMNIVNYGKKMKILGGGSVS